MGLFTPAVAMAHDGETHSADDATIEHNLKEQGLDKAPEPVTIPKSEMYGLKPSSGFVDENGKPLSDEEYAAYRKEQEKGIFEKYPFVTAGLALGVTGLIVYKVKKRR